MTERLQLEEEVRQIQERVAAAKHGDRVEIILRLAVRWNELQKILRDVRPHIVHFSCHGTGQEELLLADEGGRHRAVTGSALADLFRLLGEDVHMVVLNACYSSSQAEEIARHIECVVGMRRRIGDAAAITFSEAFYPALAYGDGIQKAFDLGKNQLALGGFGDAEVPQLLLKPGVDPTRLILLSPAPPSPRVAPLPPRPPAPSILLHIDLALDNRVDLDHAKTLLPDKPDRTLHLSDYGVQPTPRGSELSWDRCVRAIDKMMAAARKEASSLGRAPQYYVVGHGALPVFAYLGLELAAWADVILLNQRRDKSWDVLRISDGQPPPGERFFDVVRGLEDAQPSPAEGRVGVFISTKFPLKEDDIDGFMRAQGGSLAGIVEVRTGGPGETILDASNAARASHELMGIFDRIPTAYPHRTGLAVFIGGPVTLAFLVGRAINPRVFREVLLPNYDGQAYQPALTFQWPRGRS
jgi:hypothetical protein